MRNWKRGPALLLAAVLSLCALSGCGRAGQGLEFSACVGGEPEELDPIYATSAADQTILVHLYDNLMRKIPGASGGSSLSNGAAQDVQEEENADGSVTYTFKIRGEWSDGRDVQAEDFVFAWQRLADPANGSPNASLLSVVAGYDTVQESGDPTALQVSAGEDNTFVVVLNGRYEWFLSEVCTAPATMPLRQYLVQPEEAEDSTEGAEAEEEESPAAWWSDVAALVTNGPYQVSAYDEGTSLTLTASGTYEDAAGPETLIFRFTDAQAGQELYDSGTVDFLGALPEARLAELVQEESPSLATELGVHAVRFQCSHDTLMDARIRLALSLVIDRTAVAQAAGAAASPSSGLIPPGVPGDEETDFRTAGGELLDNDPAHQEELLQEARRLLQEAGYGDVESLGQLEYLYVDTDREAAVAQILVDNWRDALGIEVTARAVTEEEMAAALRDGDFTMASAEVLPMGNDAECYLMEWQSTSALNTSRYNNSAYDTLLSVIAAAQDETARMGCLHDAEALLLEEGAIAPLYTTVTAWSLRDGLTGVLRDARGWFSFAAVREAEG